MSLRLGFMHYGSGTHSQTRHCMCPYLINIEARLALFSSVSSEVQSQKMSRLINGECWFDLLEGGFSLRDGWLEGRHVFDKKNLE